MSGTRVRPGSGNFNPNDMLSPFYQDGFIDDILFLVKSGKEATVYCCQPGPHIGVPLIAAKLYRPREHRSFSNAAVYMQGRTITNSRARKAVQQRTKRGLAMEFEMWSGHEARALGELHTAGVRVPRLITSGEHVLLMEFMGDENGAAPRLADIDLTPDEARRCLNPVLRDIETMLLSGHVHGDLSPYNLLFWDGAVTIIDVPQTVNPWQNPDAFDLLVRDITNVIEYFDTCGARCPPPESVAREMWGRMRRRK